jgi:hypothetical protein
MMTKSIDNYALQLVMTKAAVSFPDNPRKEKLIVQPFIQTNKQTASIICFPYIQL